MARIIFAVFVFIINGVSMNNLTTTQRIADRSKRKETLATLLITFNPANTEQITIASNVTTASNLPTQTADQVFLHTLTIFNTLLGVCCILLSSAVIAYYWKTSTTKLFSMLYLRNGVVDVGYGIGILIQTPIILLVISGSTLSQTGAIFLFAGYMMTSLFARLSAFLNCAISVSRCINIVFPFYNLHRASVKAAVTAATLLYAAVWGGIAAYDIYGYAAEIGLDLSLYLVKSTALKPEVGWYIIFEILNGTGTENGLNSLLYFFIPFALPALICLALLFPQVLHLKKSGDKSGGSGNRRHVVTILILTTIFVITNLASISCWMAVYSSNLTSFKPLSWMEICVIYVATATCPLLCSTLTPLTLVIRGRKGNKSIVKFITGRAKGIKTVTTDTTTM